MAPLRGRLSRQGPPASDRERPLRVQERPARSVNPSSRPTTAHHADSIASLPRQKVNVVWFKVTDLRTHDHAALLAAHGENLPVLHLFVFDPIWYEQRAPLTGLPRTGAIRARFQLECLTDLRARLEQAGHTLAVRVGGSTAAVFRELCRDFDVAKVFAFHDVCDEEQRVLASVRQELKRSNAGPLQLQWGFELYHHDDLPWDPRKRRPTSYSAFRRSVEERSTVRAPMPVPDMQSSSSACWPGYDDVALPSLQELIQVDDADVSQDPRAELHWVGGETAALERVDNYLFKTQSLGLEYVGATMTTNPSKSVLRDGALSKLSPWLAHGCLSPRRLHAEVKRYEKECRKGKSTYWILHELCWRDFVRFGSLYFGSSIFKLAGPNNQHPQWQWSRDPKLFKSWCTGTTGYPFIDSFMRELRSTGYCNHMGREIAGWVLLRDLAVDWRMGAEWFESVLIDYEPAANWFNWVYRCLPAIAKSNPKPMEHLQTLEVLVWGAQHDPDAEYTKRWLPELRPLPPVFAREPWRLKIGEGEKVDVGNFRYGVDYPLPLISPLLVKGIEDVAAQARDAQVTRDGQIAEARRRLKSNGGRGTAISSGDGVRAPEKDRRKEVMKRAWQIFQKDHGGKGGKEWKRLRAAGGTDPTLASYLSKAGWDPSWPMPEPEGRALRRERDVSVKKTKEAASTT